jgi:hypothetical protein
MTRRQRQLRHAFWRFFLSALGALTLLAALALPHIIDGTVNTDKSITSNRG